MALVSTSDMFFSRNIETNGNIPTTTCLGHLGGLVNRENKKFIVVGQRLRESKPLQDALKCFSGQIHYSDTGFEHMVPKEDHVVPIFVVNNFEGSIYQQLVKHRCRIMAPPVILKCAFHRPLPLKSRPIYSLSMENVVLCFSGFKIRENLSLLVDLVHRMGGSIRKEFGSRITHLVANNTTGDKYRAAVGMGVHIMSEEWIHKCWEMRDDAFFEASIFMTQYKLSPFTFSILSFYGFPNDEIRHMEEVTVNNGGTVVQYGAPMTTHLIVNERSIKSIPFEIHNKLHVVKSEWFWASIQMEACADESLYLYDEDATTNTPGSNKRTPNTPLSNGGNRNNKRKRLRDNLAHLANEGEYDVPACKRTSLDVPNRNSISSSFLDATADTSIPTINEISPIEFNPFVDSPTTTTTTTTTTTKQSTNNNTTTTNNVNKESLKLTARQQTILELYQTERNYVGILSTIIKVFKEELERTDQPGGPILDGQEIKAIFGGITCIHDIHIMIRDELNHVVNNWNDNQSVGTIFIKHSEDLMKLYPNFINYFERSREAIVTCDRTKPRFHAFLKLCQSKAECGRQTLTELLIRPVQRLPSVTLLLKDILKRTDEEHTDRKLLQDAIIHLEAVMMHINEDKRRSEAHQVMFEIINEIENCPASLLSAHRSFSMKVDVTEVSDILVGKGTLLTLFIFSDSLEICKKRVRLMNNNNKCPSTTTSTSATTTTPSSKYNKVYKHVSLVQFSCIKRIVDICDLTDSNGVFALVIKRMDEDEQLFAFNIINNNNNNNNSNNNATFMNNTIINNNTFINNNNNTIMSNNNITITNNNNTTINASGYYNTTQQQHDTKEDLLIFLSKAVCTNMCRTDYETLLAAVESHELSINVTDLNNKKSFTRAASKLGKKVSRVFSLNKTPNGMKRAISSVTQLISPMRKENSSACITTPTSASKNNFHNKILPQQESSADRYSEIVDKMSIGTPAMQRRRETLAGITYSDLNGLNHNRQEPCDIKMDQSEAIFLTPHSIPIKHRNNKYKQSQPK